MYNIGDYVVYKRDVCMILEIKENYYNDTDYYVLSPIKDSSLKINVPTNNKKLLRNLMSKEEVESLIKKIPNIEVVDVDDKLIEYTYKELLKSESHEDLVKIIKTSYLRNKDRTLNNKKPGEKDSTYFNLAELYLYNEFSVVLGKTFEDTKNYVISKVENLV